MDRIESLVTIDEDTYLVVSDWAGNTLDIYHWENPLRPVELDELTCAFLAQVETELHNNLYG